MQVHIFQALRHRRSSLLSSLRLLSLGLCPSPPGALLADAQEHVAEIAEARPGLVVVVTTVWVSFCCRPEVHRVTLRLSFSAQKSARPEGAARKPGPAQPPAEAR